MIKNFLNLIRTNKARSVLIVSGLVMGTSYILKALGYDIGLTNDDANAIAGGLVTIIGLFLATGKENKASNVGTPVSELPVEPPADDTATRNLPRDETDKAGA